MVENLVLRNREQLRTGNYVIKASKGFWGFEESVMNRYRGRLGDYFNLIIPLREDSPLDFYIIPYKEVSHLLTDKTYTSAGKDIKRRRWAGRVDRGKFYVSGHGTIDVSSFYGPAAVLRNPELFDNSDVSESTRSIVDLAMLDAEQGFETEEHEFPEGRLQFRRHRKRERNNKAVSMKKEKAARKEKLSCEACGFDFFARYGDIGKGFIECHHLQPISEYVDGQTTKLTDLALVCANCHRMLHRFPSGISIARFQKVALKERCG